jgi:hypothetical protein
MENYRATCRQEMTWDIPEGCGSEILGHYQCKSTTTFQCTGLESPECSGEAVLSCTNDFITRTGCSRPDGIDMSASCSNGQFGFSCNGSAPSGCTLAATADGRTYCCAQFPD